MLYVIHCTDKPDSAHVRAANRPAHLAYAETHRDILYIGGPTLSDDGNGMTGSVLIVDFENMAEAEEFATGDPYAQAGLFESVTIEPWKMVFAPK